MKIALLTIKPRRTGAFEIIDQIFTRSIVLTWHGQALIYVLVTIGTSVSRYTIALVCARHVLAVTIITNTRCKALVNVLGTVETFKTPGTRAAVVADQVDAGCPVLARVGRTFVNILVTVRAREPNRTTALIPIHFVKTFIISWARNAIAVIDVLLAELSCIAQHALAFELVAGDPLLRGWVTLSPIKAWTRGTCVVRQFACSTHKPEKKTFVRILNKKLLLLKLLLVKPKITLGRITLITQVVNWPYYKYNCPCGCTYIL